MTREEARDLAAMYALGALDGADEARFQAMVHGGDPDATEALVEFEATLRAVAMEHVVSPSPAVKMALLARIATQARARPSAVATPTGRRARWRAVWAAALAAGLAAIVVGLALSARYERRLDSLAREAAALQGTLARERQILDLLQDPSTVIIALAGLEPAPAARARMVWNAPAGGLLVVSGLPPAPEGKTYQLWAIVGKKPPVSAGVFGVNAEGTGSLRVSALPDVDKVDVFAVTLEPAGGVSAPSGAMYLAGKS